MKWWTMVNGQYPVGAKWQAVEDNWIYHVWLKDRSHLTYHDKYYEEWICNIYTVDWATGETTESKYWDWFPNKEAACKEARSWMNKKETKLRRIE